MTTTRTIPTPTTTQHEGGASGAPQASASGVVPRGKVLGIRPAMWPGYFAGMLERPRGYVRTTLHEFLDEARDHLAIAQARGLTRVAEGIAKAIESARGELVDAAYGFGPANPEECGEGPDGFETKVPPAQMAAHWRAVLAFEHRKITDAVADYDSAVRLMCSRIAEAQTAGDLPMVNALRAVLADPGHADARPAKAPDAPADAPPSAPPADPKTPGVTPVIEVDFRPAPRPAPPYDLPPAAEADMAGIEGLVLYHRVAAAAQNIARDADDFVHAEVVVERWLDPDPTAKPKLQVSVQGTAIDMESIGVGGDTALIQVRSPDALRLVTVLLAAATREAERRGVMDVASAPSPA